MVCPLCERDCPDQVMEAHHLRTRKRDKTDTEEICTDCHKTIHALFTNQQLGDPRLDLDTVEGLLANEQFARSVRYIAKQPPGSYLRVRESNQRRQKRGRR